MEFPTTAIWLLSLFTTFYKQIREKVPTEEPPIDVDHLRRDYDYVIIGGGSAGCVLASRLSEDPNVNVALLEVGGQETALSEIPGSVGYLQLSNIDWQYKSEPSSAYCLAMKENRCNFPRGKVIGGSSTINYMVYVRGNKHDYDLWEEMGNPGWGYRDVLPLFKLSEDNKNPSIAEDTDFHGTGGLLTVGEAKWRTELAPAFLDAAEELGYPVRDCNADEQFGFMITQGTTRKGGRCSNSRAFLRPVRNRPNLHVALHAFVTKILIHKLTKRAYGVSFDRKGKHGLNVFARREVILSAGSINSAQLLMLSGIGPAHHLAMNNIPIIEDLPVGRNLMDHVAAGPIFTIEKPVSLQAKRLSTITSTLQYAFLTTGPLTTLGGVEAIGFLSTKFASKANDWPDIEYHFLSGSHGSDHGAFFHKMLGLRMEYWTDFYDHLQDVDHFTIITKLLRPQSRGYIELESSNPYSYPKIVPNYFDKRKDVMVLIEGIRKAIELGETEAMKEFGARLFSRPVPGCEVFEFNSDDYWECYARFITFTIYHYSGTAKMGPHWDPESVVDSELRVYGISGLRVVDASIFPTITSGNTNAPTTMVAEKAALMIRNFYYQNMKNFNPIIPIKDLKSNHSQFL